MLDYFLEETAPMKRFFVGILLLAGVLALTGC
jgi:hypothetical protein